MSVSQLPSGRWRAQTYNPATGKYESSATILGLTEKSFKTEPQARRAWAKATELLAERRGSTLTLAEWAERWTTDPLYKRPQESTNIYNRERIAAFVYGPLNRKTKERKGGYGHLPLTAIGDEIVAQWLAGGKNTGSVAVLKAMWNDAMSAKAGRLVMSNPWVGLGLKKSRGRKDMNPPSEEQVHEMLDYAERTTTPGFHAWLKTACWVGMRPGELDALQRTRIDFEANRVHVLEQWNTKTRTFTPPKNHLAREILLTPYAREALIAHQPGLKWCFENTQGNHWTTSARSHWWDRVRAHMGWLDKDSRVALYLATRHFAGWYFYNILELPSEDVAIQLGHEDGGELVRTLYGHRDRVRTLARIERAFAEKAASERLPGLRIVRGDSA